MNGELREASRPAIPQRLLRPDDVRRSIDNCTKCGICQAYCPVAAVTEAFPGPKYAGPQAERFRGIGVATEVSPALCSGCGICSSVCPNDVAIADVIALARADLADNGRNVGIGQRLLNRPDTIGRLGGIAPWLGNAILSNGVARRVAEWAFGLDRRAPLPRFAGPRFSRWFAQQSQPNGLLVSYFPGCAGTHYDPQPSIAAVRFLNALGYRVEVPSVRCCGLPMMSSGEWPAGRKRAAALLRDLAASAIAGRCILTTSTSCGLTLRSKYAAYYDVIDDGSAAVSRAVIDICGFLLDRHGPELSQRFGPLRKRVLYHGPCQLRGHHMGQPAAELLAMIPDLEVVLSGADCCGVAGTYGYDKPKRPVAEAVGRTLLDEIGAHAPDLVVCDSETCRWSISHESGVPCVHPVELFHAALRMD